MKSLNLPIRAIAFDLDGTLVDSAKGLTEALAIAFQTYQLQAPSEYDVKGWIGNGMDKLIERGLEHVNAPIALQSEIRPVFDKAYTETIKTGTQLYPKVIETLAYFKHEGISLAVITNKASQFLPALLADLNLSEYFDHVLGAEDVSVKKPHPAPLYKLCAELGIFTQQLAFVGDSANDILAAKNAGAISVGLTYGYNYHQPISLSKPDYICETFDQIIECLLPKIDHNNLYTQVT